MELEKILSTPTDRRDQSWENQFFDAFARANVTLDTDTPQLGPDGWPYMMVSTGDDGKEPCSQLLHWLSERGIGLAVNAKKGVPDFVFNYGMIWSYRQFNRFIHPMSDEIPSGELVFEEGSKLNVGEPSEEFWPGYVRKVVREFFHQQGLIAPKMAVVSQDQKHFDICFSVESLGSPPKEELRGIAETIAWFFPNHYSIVLLPESALPKTWLI